MFKKFLWVLPLFLLANCAVHRPNTPINPALIENPPSVVMVEVDGLETATFYNGGQQGMLDVLINSIVGKDMREAVYKTSGRDIVENRFFKAFKEKLEKINFKISRFSKKLEQDDLKSAPKNDENHAPYDFSALHSTLGADYALVFEPKLFGVNRDYYGFIPLGAPVGVSHVLIYFVNLQTNELEGYFDSSIRQSVAGEWDQPGYHALTCACSEALEKAIMTAGDHFFEDGIYRMKAEFLKGRY